MISLEKNYLVLFLLISLTTSAFTCNDPDDYAALYALYHSFNGKDWNETSWVAGNDEE